MAESVQQKLSRVRPPRVQITYDVETGGALQKKELPFIVGIMADLSGHRANDMPKLKDRKFVEIDRDNYDTVMEAIHPRLALRVPNRLSKTDGEMLNVDLRFAQLDDFGPVELVKQIKPLAELYEARNRLRDLLIKLDGNDELDAILSDVVASTEKQAKLRAELGKEAAAAVIEDAKAE